jgi:hypothetical protein
MKHCILKRKSNEREVEEEMNNQKSPIEREREGLVPISDLLQTGFKTLVLDQKVLYNTINTRLTS